MKTKRFSLFRAVALLSFASFLGLGAMRAQAANPLDHDQILRVEVLSKNGDQVEVSVPLSLIKTLYAVMPDEIIALCKELSLTPEIILSELDGMEGEDLVRVTGEDNIRVWVVPVSEENRKDVERVRIHYKEKKENGQDVKVCVPRGLIALTGRVIKELGLIDQYAELPEELRKLKVKKESAPSATESE